MLRDSQIFEAGVRVFGEEIKDEEDALMILPGRTETEV